MSGKSTEYENLAFQEEKENLKKIENQINGIIDSFKKRYEEKKKEVEEFETFDKEDISNKQDLIAEMESSRNSVENFKKYLPSPYIGRVDIAQGDNEPEVLFIGKESISNGAESTENIEREIRESFTQRFFGSSDPPNGRKKSSSGSWS